MQTDKAFLEFNGKLMYEYPLSVLENLCDEIIISSSNERFREKAYICIPDLIENIGPIGGIYTGLSFAGSQKSLVLSCDIPLVSIELGKILIRKSENSRITVGINRAGLPEPLAGVYDKTLIKEIEELIRKGNYKTNYLLKGESVNLIDIEKEGFNSDRIYFNVNSLSDLTKLRQIYGS